MNSILTAFQSLAAAGWIKVALGIVAGLIGLAASAFSLRAGLINLQRQKQAKLIQDQALWSGTVSDFTKEDITASLKHYVVPDCSQTDPANSSDIRRAAGVREPVIRTVDRFITNSENRHLLVLADTGMGKTSFCLNYLAHRNRLNKGEGALSCAVIPLGRPDALEKIRRVPNPADTILLLDAFDEDVRAIDNSDERLSQLLNQAAEFGTVIITCRSQFFKNDLAIPSRTGVAIVRPRRAGISSEYVLETLYLLPFTPKQIKQYINRQFPWWSWGGLAGSKMARTLTENVPELSVRPMLLALLPDLVREGRQIQELFDLYQFMTAKWLDREASWIEPSILTAVSKRLAVFIYASRGRRGSDRVTVDELHSLAQAMDIPEDRWNHLSARSLLNRDSEGNIKFSHRSIMEFYFVLSAIDGDPACFKVFWSDFMRELFVSWGNSQQGQSNVVRAKQILAMDLNKLGLSPLSEPLDGPQDYSVRTFINSRASRQRRIADAWRADSIKILSAPNQIHRVIEDAEFGLIWEVPHLSDYDTDEIQIIQTTHVEMIKTGMSKRLASKVQFLALLEAEASLDMELLMRETFLWLGDRIGKRSPIVVSVSDAPLEHSGVKLLGQLSGKDRNGTPVWAYEVLTQPTGFGSRVAVVSAIPTLVSETDRQSRQKLHSMSPEELRSFLDGLNHEQKSLTAEPDSAS
ncbi:NACHT domain-containing protein [Caulobacter vibrioides]|nr:hypothetical protein [Caulobacter vibrioides]